MSQEQLGEKIGLTFQQVQKYERGANRVGASRLWELALVMDVPVQYFFAEMPEETVLEMRQIQSGVFGLGEDPPVPYQTDPLARREVLELVRAYSRIMDATVRHRLFELTKTLAGETEGDKSAKS